MNKLRNRGKAGNDDKLFGSKSFQLKIKEACIDMSYLLERGYGEKIAMQIVGNRYLLNNRQQQVLRGMSASQTQVKTRKSTEINSDDLKHSSLIIDGFNLLIILESALSGAYVFKGLDDCFRDISGVHGTYKKVNQTIQVLNMVGDYLNLCGVNHVIWVLDKPVSNSGRLKTLMREIAEENKYPWEIILDNNPDKMIAESECIGVSSDAWILDRVGKWYNLASTLIYSFKDEGEIVSAY